MSNPPPPGVLLFHYDISSNTIVPCRWPVNIFPSPDVIPPDFPNYAIMDLSSLYPGYNQTLQPPPPAHEIPNDVPQNTSLAQYDQYDSVQPPPPAYEISHDVPQNMSLAQYDQYNSMHPPPPAYEIPHDVPQNTSLAQYDQYDSVQPPPPAYEISHDVPQDMSLAQYDQYNSMHPPPPAFETPHDVPPNLSLAQYDQYDSMQPTPPAYETPHDVPPNLSLAQYDQYHSMQPTPPAYETTHDVPPNLSLAQYDQYHSMQPTPPAYETPHDVPPNLSLAQYDQYDSMQPTPPAYETPHDVPPNLSLAQYDQYDSMQPTPPAYETPHDVPPNLSLAQYDQYHSMQPTPPAYEIPHDVPRNTSLAQYDQYNSMQPPPPAYETPHDVPPNISLAQFDQTVQPPLPAFEIPHDVTRNISLAQDFQTMQPPPPAYETPHDVPPNLSLAQYDQYHSMQPTPPAYETTHDVPPNLSLAQYDQYHSMQPTPPAYETPHDVPPNLSLAQYDQYDSMQPTPPAYETPHDVPPNLSLAQYDQYDSMQPTPPAYETPHDVPPNLSLAQYDQYHSMQPTPPAYEIPHDVPRNTSLAQYDQYNSMQPPPPAYETPHDVPPNISLAQFDQTVQPPLPAFEIPHDVTRNISLAQDFQTMQPPPPAYETPHDVPPNLSLAHSSRGNLSQPGEPCSPYKPPRPPTASPSPSTYANYPPSHNSMRYVQQQSPYGTSVAYRDNPYSVRPAPVVNERQPPIEFVRIDTMPPQARPGRISLLTNLASNPDYLPAVARNRIPQPDQYRERTTVDLVAPSTSVGAETYASRERDRERTIDLVNPANSAQPYRRMREMDSPLDYVSNTAASGEQQFRVRDRDREIEMALDCVVTPSVRGGEPYQNRERERDRDCIVMPPNQPSSMPDLGPSAKKIRLGEPKPELQQQLRIDTRSEQVNPAPAYNPQVEAISPTLPSESIVEDANFRSTKDDLLQQISKVDREISKTEAQILLIKKTLQELEESACRPVEAQEVEEDRMAQQPKMQSLAQKIYAENRRKAQKAHSVLESMGPRVDLPLYNQPSDNKVYHENKKRHLAFKKRLGEFLGREKKEKEQRENFLTQTYSRLVQEWHRKLEKIESSAKRKAKDAKYREFFEKVFPELRKQREDRERFNRVGARVKSEAELEEIVDGLQEQEMEDKKMRSYAVIPPLLLNARQRRSFKNDNGKIDDFAAMYKERQLSNVWTKSEIEIFKEKFLQHPKNFGVIASFLDRKSACDCVQYYYHSKKEENYKRLLRKSRQRTRSSRNPHGKVTAASGAASTSGASTDPMDSILSSVTGVTTRLQREQLQKQEQPAAPAPGPLPPPAPSETPSVTPPPPEPPICDTNTVETRDNNPSPPLLTMAVTPPPATDSTPLSTEGPLSTAATSATTTTAISAPASASASATASSDVKIDSKKKERRKEEKKKKEEELGETTDEEMADPQGNDKGMQPCIVCKVESECTRALPRSHAAQYGLCEEDVPAGARVCNTCRCKSVRSRYTQCPLPTCPNSKGQRVKRLRPLPMKWPELPRHIRDPIAAEFQIPATVTRCCLSCYNRIARKLSPMEEGSGSGRSSPSAQLPRWSEEETDALKRGLREHGLHWAEVSQVVGPSKTLQQCRNFYFNYRKKIGLDLILKEYNKTHLGEERKPSLTDEEESGSSTSSCDEAAGMGLLADSDTASAGSPGQHIDGAPKEKVGEDVKEPESNSIDRDNLGPPILVAQKEDYDSSATETADEGQGGGETESRAQPGQSPLTVKDIMLNVIERQLMKNQVAPGHSSAPPPGPAPTISSILKTNNMATLSVVHPPELPKENIVVVQVQPPLSRDRETEGTLDLSIKKPRTELREMVHTKHSPLAPPHSVTVYRTASTHTDSNYYHQVASPQLSSKLSPKLSPGLLGAGVGGSIMHGTPVSSPSLYSGSSQAPRYDNSPLLRQMTPPHAAKEAAGGSITQGTPVHQRGIYPGSANNEYYGSGVPGGSSAVAKRPPAPSQSFYPPRTPAYAVEQRQIIMNDYITSQHMPPSATRRTNEKTTLYYQPRQGVIQRHNTKPPSPHHYPASHKPPSPHHYPPGHEAFSSLVDVAVRQPSLPVPLPEHKEDKRLLHEGLGERFNRDNSQDRFAGRDQERFSRENHQIHHRSLSENHHQQMSQPPRDLHPQQQIRGDHQLHQPIHHHRDLERERSHIQHSELRELQQLHHHQQMQQHQRDLVQKQRDLLQKQQQLMRENHLHQLQQQQQQQREMEHHRMGRIQQLSSAAGYPQQRDEPAPGRMMPFREQPPPPPRSHADASREVNTTPVVSGSGGPNRGSGNRGGQGSDSSTLTAASLIDAIITHQINQTSNEGGQGQSGGGPSANPPQPQVTRPGDRLFQGFHRDGPEANGKLSPMKPSGLTISGSPDPKQASLTLGDHIESIINKDYPPTSRHGQFQNYEPQAWKLRRALQQKELDQSQAMREKSDDRNIVRMAGPPSPSSRARYYEPPAVPLSPLDYVKNRIVEVMRTSEEEGGSKSGGGDSPGGGEMVIDEGEEQQQPPHPPAPTPFIATSAAYTYPFSALSLNTGAPPVPVSVANTAPKQPVAATESIPEPAPLLSAQYEPLSDED